MQETLFDLPAPPIDRFCAFNGKGHIIRQSEAFPIGRHEWRLVLYRCNYTFKPFTDYEWRRADGKDHRCGDARMGYYSLPGETWREAREWRGYDDHKGETAGLPAKLARLWDRCPWADARTRRAEVLRNGVRRYHGPAPTIYMPRRDTAFPDWAGYYWLAPEDPYIFDEAGRLRGPFPTVEERATVMDRRGVQ